MAAHTNGGGFGRSQPAVDAAEVRTAARGRWRDILPRLGVPDEALTGRHGPCPGCGGRDRFRFDDREGRGTFICSQGGGSPLSGDGFALLQHVHGWDFRTALAEVARAVGSDRDFSGGQNDHAKTAERIATEHGTSEKTVRAKKAHGGTGANQYVQSGQNDQSATAGHGGERRSSGQNDHLATAQRIASEHGTSKKTERARRVVRESRSPAATIVECYLRTRAVVLPEDADIWFHPAVWHWPTQSRLPAMVCPIVPVEAVEGDPCQAAHLTFLEPDGSGKARIDEARLYQGPTKRGVVKLTPDAAVDQGLAIAEGVETALAAIMAGFPTWATLNAGNMADFPVLGGIDCLTVVADHDKAGINAADAVAARWTAAGKEVRIILPDAYGADLNDIAREAAHG